MKRAPTMDDQDLRRRFAALGTAHLADACIRNQLPVRCAPAALRVVEPGSRVALEAHAAGLEGVQRLDDRPPMEIGRWTARTWCWPTTTE